MKKSQQCGLLCQQYHFIDISIIPKNNNFKQVICQLLSIIVLFACSYILIPTISFAQSSDSATIIISPDGNQENKQNDNQPQKQTGDLIVDIIVNGIQRIEYETVVALLGFKQGGVYNRQLSNKALKQLFQSQLFDDVVLSYDAATQTVTVDVTERPLINRVVFEGNEGIVTSFIKPEVKLKPRSVFSRDKVQADANRIKKLYERTGRFAAKIEPKIIRLPQNRLDVVFEITEGPVTKIDKISFVGNEFIDDNGLLDIIASHEDVWYRFLSNLDRYDPDRIEFDSELLRRYYLTHGFIDFKVTSAVAELDRQKSGFFVTFTLDEGKRFTNGNVKITSQIDDIDINGLYQFVTFDKDDFYNVDDVSDTIRAIRQELGKQGYGFINIAPAIERDNDKQTVDINFIIDMGQRIFVERIDIRGNVRTKDKVLRREMTLVEGDGFNSQELGRSRANIESLGYFSKVTVNTLPGNKPDSTVIDVAVQEQTTGELNLGVGYSSQNGGLVSFGVKENNLVGSGLKLGVNASLAERNQLYDISITDPYFLDNPLSASARVFSEEKDLSQRSGYKRDTIGGSVGIGYDLFDKTRQNISFGLEDRKIHSVTTTAVTAGKTLVASITNRFSYRDVDSPAQPRQGKKASFSTTYAGLGGDTNYLRNIISGTYYQRWSKSVHSSFHLEAGNIFSLDNKAITASNHFALGNKTFRGFDDSGVGPRNPSNNLSTGGVTYAISRNEVFFKSGLPEELNVLLSSYLDFGFIGDSQLSVANNQDKFKPRASIGMGINWQSPVGVMRFDIAKPVKKESYDKEKTFKFNLGTNF